MLTYWQQAADIFEALDDPIRLSSTLAGIALATGAFPFETVVTAKELSYEEALRILNRSLQLARTVGWRSGEAYALQMLAMTSMWHGSYDQALMVAHEGLEIAEDINHLEWTSTGYFTVGYMFDAFFDHAAGLAAYEHAYTLAIESGSTFFSYMGTGVLASALIARDQFERATELLATAPDEFLTDTISTRRIVLSRAEQALAQGNPGQALEIVDQLYTTAINLTKPADIPVLARSRGQALLGLGRYAESLEMFEVALDGAIERGPRILVWRLHVWLGQLHQIMDHPDQARHAYDAARAEIRSISSKISEPDLREKFLSGALQLVSKAESA